MTVISRSLSPRKMPSFKLSFLLLAALSSVCYAKKQCEPVKACPNYLWPLQNTIVQNIINHFNRPTPQDGTCPSGQQKYIFYGGDFGYKENRCVCLTTPPSQYKQCGSGIPQCPAMPDAFKDELVGRFFARVGSTLRGGPADGCCPAGDATWIAEPQYTGARSNLCFCVSQSKLVLH